MAASEEGEEWTQGTFIKKKRNPFWHYPDYVNSQFWYI